MACPPRPETWTGSGGATGCGYTTIFTHYECLTLHHHILPCQVWARECWNNGPPSPSRDRDGIGRRDLAGTCCSGCNIQEENPGNSGPARQPALPVPRPGRDREARREVDIQLFSLIMSASLYITTSCHARSGPGVWTRE